MENSENNKTARIEIRCTKEEKQLLMQKAKESRRSMTQYLLYCIENKKIYEIKYLPQLVEEMSSVGRDINKIAAQVNDSKNVTAYQLELVDEKMKKVVKLMEYVVRQVIKTEEQ